MKLLNSLILVFGVCVLILITISPPSVSSTGEELIDVTCRDMDLQEALRTIAELAGVNLVTDGTIEGKITLTLNNISFKEALLLITRTQGLDYFWNNNTVIVGRPEHLDDAFRGLVTDIKYLHNREPQEVKSIVKSLYKNVDIEIDNNINGIIIRGRKTKIEEIKDFINKMDTISINEEEEISYKYVKVNKGDLKNLKENIMSVYPNLEVNINEKTNDIFLAGSGSNIEGAEEIISIFNNIENKIKEKPDSESISRIYRVNYLKTEQMAKILKNIYSEDLNINFLKDKVILAGQKDIVKIAVQTASSMDKPQKQVRIEARVEEISTTNLKDIGLNPDQLSQIKILQNKDKFNGLTISWPDFLEMIEDKGTARTLACPSLLTMNGEEASLLIGDQIPIKLSSTEEGQIVEEIKYIEAGINLVFEPWITDNGEIILNINPRISSLGESIGNSMPTINTREIKTKIRVNNGETFVIGGLLKDDKIITEKMVPLIGEIPILGQLFSLKKENNINTEVLIFITPTILDNKIQRENKSDNQEGKSILYIENYKIDPKRRVLLEKEY